MLACCPLEHLKVNMQAETMSMAYKLEAVLW